MKKKRVCGLALVLIFALCLSTAAFADESPITVRSSEYLDFYNATIQSTGNGGVTVYFQVAGTRTMDQIGSSVIHLYEKNGSTWSIVKTFRYTDSQYASSMMGYNTAMKAGSVSYTGTVGKQYSASVSVVALLGNDGDYDRIGTNTVTA